MDDPDKMIASLTAMNDSLLTMFTPAYMICATLFSLIGIAAYFYGRRTSRRHTKWVGIALMLYPLVVWQTWMMYAVGIGLCASLYFVREK